MTSYKPKRLETEKSQCPRVFSRLANTWYCDEMRNSPHNLHPTEVLDEMLKPVYDAVDRLPAAKKAANYLFNAVDDALFTLTFDGPYALKSGLKAIGKFVSLLSTPFFIPTLARLGHQFVKPRYGRRIYSNDQSRFVEEKPNQVGYGIGFGMVAGVTGLLEYAAFHEPINSNPQYLAIPLATNVLSGLYELGRKAYRKTRERLVRRHQDLESRTSE